VAKKLDPPAPDLAAFGRRLRELRHEAGLTQEALAGASSMHWSYIGQAEGGIRNVTLRTILNLASGLEREPYELLMPASE
jgi:transcriptional regulator with XRE-family HTH domain